MLPAGCSRGAVFPVDVLGDGDASSIVLSIYDSKDAADTAYDAVTKGLLRAGWQSRDVDGIDNDHACLSVVSSGAATAVCYVTRDQVIITTSSFLPVATGDRVWSSPAVVDGMVYVGRGDGRVYAIGGSKP